MNKKIKKQINNSPIPASNLVHSQVMVFIPFCYAEKTSILCVLLLLTDQQGNAINHSHPFSSAFNAPQRKKIAIE
jgi:hypothetical protein